MRHLWFVFIGSIAFVTTVAQAADSSNIEIGSYNQDDQLIKIVKPDGTTIEYTYDNNGNLSQKKTSEGTWNFIYNEEDQLVRVEKNLSSGTQTIIYAYDPAGRRVFKDVDGVRTYYFYTDEGLAEEYDNAGKVIRQYGHAPDSSLPRWVKTDTGTYFYYYDQLGTPQKLVDQNGTIVWEAIYDDFGKAQVITEIVENNLRFPGQYYDAETGLHYNWHRYYDPETGRYLTRDPMGDDANDYVYAGNNPVNAVDPTGLAEEGDYVDLWAGVRANSTRAKMVLRRRTLYPHWWNGGLGGSIGVVEHHVSITEFSNFTSWSLVRGIAENFATEEGAGYLLKVRVPLNQIVLSPDTMEEAEVLLFGPRRFDSMIKLSGPVQRSREEILAILDRAAATNDELIEKYIRYVQRNPSIRTANQIVVVLDHLEGELSDLKARGVRGHAPERIRLIENIRGLRGQLRRIGTGMRGFGLALGSGIVIDWLTAPKAAYSYTPDDFVNDLKAYWPPWTAPKGSWFVGPAFLPPICPAEYEGYCR